MTGIIVADRTSKTFRQRRRYPGLLGSFKGLVSPEYTEVKAVDEISFTIGAGEAVGYLGPNGAGKSTMIKMMTGILVPSNGGVSVLGRVPHKERMANAREIGVVFGQRSQLWWDLPVRDSFELSRHIYDIAQSRFDENLGMLCDMLGIAPFLDRPVRQLSLGQRMRAEIAMSLLHDPKILFLDEPTIGLDVMAKDVVRKFLSQINKERGVTIILTTHDLQDIEQICPRLIMVDDGKLLFDGELTKLRTAFGARRRLTLEFKSDPGDVVLSCATPVRREGMTRHFLLDNDKTSLVDVLTELGNGYDLHDVSLDAPDIEEVIRTYYQNRLAVEAA
ncbi:ABC transporter ATP-binding protein [Rhizobium rhizogenes]|uniref:ABC transporter ATP-binding protein n=1 Tax=Rhizobium rhizogenes TaxID=359 RepID=UPI001572D7DA|nr:ATP-binding cassette domain-containing protein [Rhizobium rhizogenes]NTF83615.1 ATP-binding cassette domain-containing protein [Rhizobium rhizogenes]